MTAKQRMRSYLARVATGPHMSKDLERAEARDGMAMILRGEVDPVQSAVFLIALRMKRETLEEYIGALEALREAVDARTVAVPNLVELGDPYDGFVRHLPASPFLPAVLAACGVAAYSHGCRELPPKRGVTAQRVLRAAGAPVQQSADDGERAIRDRGWAYLDVRAFCPALAELEPLRDLIVKRPLLNTIEKLTGPLRGERNHLVVGYVHRGYDELLTGLARAVGYDSALVVKGIEGGVVSSLSAAAGARAFYGAGDDEELRLDPSEVGVDSSERAPAPGEGVEGGEALAAAAAEAGIAALAGAAGTTRDALVQAGSAILAHVRAAASRIEGAGMIRRVLDSGEATSRLLG